MKTRMITALAATAALACGGAQADVSTPAPSGDAPETARAGVDLVPEGTRMEIETSQDIGPEENRVGDVVNLHVDQPVLARDGSVAIPQDAVVKAELTGLYEGDDDRPAAIRIDFQTVAVDGEAHPLPVRVMETEVSASDRLSEVDETGEEAGIGAVAGAVLGGIIGEDVEGALLGAALGAGAGTALSLGQGAGAELPSGSNFHVRTTDAIRID